MKEWNFTLARPGALPFSWQLVELALDVEAMLARIPEVERDVCGMIMKGYFFGEIRRRLGLTEECLAGHIRHIREVAEEMLLDEYPAAGRTLFGF